MNIKELAEKYQSQIPKDLKDIRFLKSLYIKLGQDRIFDEKYFFGNSDTAKKIYTLAQTNRNNKEFGLEKRNIICYSLSYIVKHLLKEFGYECEVTYADKVGDHVFPIVKLDDGRRIKYDLQKDLENIQTHCKTEYFATTDRDDSTTFLTTLTEDEQLHIDIDIGYVSTINDYKNTSLEELTQKIVENPDLTLWDKLNLVLTDNNINNMSPNIGYIECFKYYYKNILPRYFSSAELAHKVHLITCSREKNGELEHTNCIYLDDRSVQESVYMFSRGHKKYVLTPYEKIIKLQEEGLNIGVNFPTNGATKLKRKLEKYISEKEDQQAK